MQYLQLVNASPKLNSQRYNGKSTGSGRERIHFWWFWRKRSFSRMKHKASHERAKKWDELPISGSSGGNEGFKKETHGSHIREENWEGLPISCYITTRRLTCNFTRHCSCRKPWFSSSWQTSTHSLPLFLNAAGMEMPEMQSRETEITSACDKAECSYCATLKNRVRRSTREGLQIVVCARRKKLWIFEATCQWSISSFRT